ncbi:hypothetical protein MASR2M78_00520 [Treponema sp.]
MKKISCSCNHVFEADLRDLIDIDQDTAELEKLAAGTFMTFTCPSCGTTVKPEYPIRVIWPSHNFDASVIPELDRGSFERGELRIENSLLVGYLELSDRIAVLKAKLEPIAIEALKYYLLLKADEAKPDAEVSAWFQNYSGDSIEFHLHGLRANEVAVSRIPYSLYERTLADFHADENAEPFVSLRKGPYLSVQNLLKPEAE